MLSVSRIFALVLPPEVHVGVSEAQTAWHDMQQSLGEGKDQKRPWQDKLCR